MWSKQDPVSSSSKFHCCVAD